MFFPFSILVEWIGEAKEYQTNFEAELNRSNYQVVPHRSQSKSVSRSPSGSDSGTAKSRSGSRSRSPSGELLAWLVKKSAKKLEMHLRCHVIVVKKSMITELFQDHGKALRLREATMAPARLRLPALVAAGAAKSFVFVSFFCICYCFCSSCIFVFVISFEFVVFVFFLLNLLLLCLFFFFFCIWYFFCTCYFLLSWPIH